MEAVIIAEKVSMTWAGIEHGILKLEVRWDRKPKWST